MKITNLLFMSVLLLGCGQENEIAPIPSGPQKNQTLEEFVEVKVPIDESIKVGNYISYEEPKILQISGDKKCSYFIKTRIDITVVDVPNDSIEIMLTKSERANNRNNRKCPPHYGVSESLLKKYSLNKLISTYQQRALEASDANIFCEHLSGCKSALLKSSRAGNYKGINATYNVIEFKMNSGEEFIRSSWVAEDNLFLNNFSFNLKKLGGRRIVDFRRALDFSMSNARRK
ncbi:putative lipoprotein [Halobacteriovorax marinus SJ]|uniref:Lipoprotein n=1 Tax=Halobacteriovorax marinus (strain ATCC BAA-682 / DSM 15412 / SJ) TaxID=862908 RepID=E1WYX8_HALMS|nr:hypothetical protein [Halobacteriovorax marinus]CBW26075.1 putative lipoprotein [Halobacteriovorax marinus SJ]